MNLRNWHRILRIWAPPLIGIPVMALLSYWSNVARYILFAHHLFWIIGGFLLINPISEAFWPSAKSEKRGTPPPQPSSKAQARAEARKLMAKGNPAASLETPAERLARLQKEMEAVDRKIKKLSTHNKERVK